MLRHENNLPEQPRRRDDVHVEELDDEAVLYDPRTGAIHRMDATAYSVWKACDGSRTCDDVCHLVATRHRIGGVRAEQLVRSALELLDQKELMVGSGATSDSALSRREVLSGGIGRALVAAPMISTFFAAGAYASGPSASAAFGGGACKNIGYSCGNANDCCEGPPQRGCQGSTCCVKSNQAGCVADADCCQAGNSCVAGTCE